MSDSTFFTILALVTASVLIYMIYHVLTDRDLHSEADRRLIKHSEAIDESDRKAIREKYRPKLVERPRPVSRNRRRAEDPTDDGVLTTAALAALVSDNDGSPSSIEPKEYTPSYSPSGSSGFSPSSDSFSSDSGGFGGMD